MTVGRPASMASSLTWWHRWGHAEAARYPPHKPTQVSCLLILTRNFSTAGSGEACPGSSKLFVTLHEKNNLFLQRTSVEKVLWYVQGWGVTECNGVRSSEYKHLQVGKLYSACVTFKERVI